MDETTLIATLEDRLDSALDVPVRTAGHEDERPVPAAIIEDWDTTDFTYHNTPFAGERVGDLDGDGNREYERVFRFYYETRVEVTARHSDEVAASRLKDDVKNVFREIRIDPDSFHAHLRNCLPRGSGNPQHQFTEPRETELGVSALFKGFHEVVRSDYDTIEQVKESFHIEQ